MIDGTAFRKSLDDLKLQLDNAAAMALDDALTVASRSVTQSKLFDDQTGLLRASTTASVDRSRLRATLRNSAKYARYVEYGTKPHIITARKAKMLRFVSGGMVHFRRSVKHPGTKPRPFMRVAGEAGESALGIALDARVDAAIRRS